MKLSRILALLALTVASVSIQAHDLKITLILVPERTACRPTGYKAGEDDQDCVQLTVGLVRKWASDWPSMPATLKPGDNAIRLNAEFSAKLHSLIRECWAPDPAKRWAMVIWITGGAGNSVVIHREACDSDNCNAKAYDRVAPISDRGNAINHQRGDVFRPAMDATWTIKSAGVEYAFTIRQPGA